MADVFVSYQRQDHEWAERVASALEARGYSVWWDTSLVAGDNWSDEIRTQLAEAKCVVVLWSEQSWKSRWVQAEAHDGFNRGVLVAASIDRVSIAPPFNIIQSADLASPNGLMALTKGVSKTLARQGIRREAAASSTPASAPIIQPASTAPPNPGASPRTPQKSRTSAGLVGALLAIVVVAAGIVAVVLNSQGGTAAVPTPPASLAGTEPREPLVDCSSAEAIDAGADGWKHPDCRLMLTDTSRLLLEARYTKADDGSARIAIQAVDKRGATAQVMNETMGNTFSSITLQDVDKDLRQDLLIPLETGNVNTTWAVWRQSDGKFVRLREVSGVELRNTDSGYLAVSARSSANEWSVSFYKLHGNDMSAIVTADVTVRGEPDRITGVDCVVTDDGGLASIGLAKAAAEGKFCAEPVVADIFK